MDEACVGLWLQLLVNAWQMPKDAAMHSIVFLSGAVQERSVSSAHRGLTSR